MNKADKKDQLREKMLKIKKRLPRGYGSVLQQRFPKKYDDLLKQARVRKVVSLQIVDEVIINDLEKITL